MTVAFERHDSHGGIVIFALDLAVDVDIDDGEKAVGFTVEAGFDLGGVVGVIGKRDLLTDQSDGSLEETAG